MRVVPDPTRPRLLDLEANECRWPVERDATVIGSYIFCGKYTENGCAYCTPHARLVYVPPPVARKRRKNETV
jgi:hypothetical protein